MATLPALGPHVLLYFLPVARKGHQLQTVQPTFITVLHRVLNNLGAVWQYGLMLSVDIALPLSQVHTPRERIAVHQEARAGCS